MPVNAGGAIAPGAGIESLSIGALSLTSASAQFALEMDLGVSPAADLLNVTGGLSLGGSTLDVSLFNLLALDGPETYLFAANDLLDPVTGTFATITGLPDDDIATIDYAFLGTDSLGRTGTGNDIAINLTPIPEPGTAAWGLGMGLIALSRRRRVRR